MDGTEMEPNRNITIVPESNADLLSEKERIDYYEHRKALLTYLLKFGKNPEKAKGYSPYTVYNTGYRAAEFDRWVWQNGREGEKAADYTFPPAQEDAAEYMEEVALSDVSDSTKGKKLEMLRRYSGWLSDQYGLSEWEFRWEFKSGGGNSGPRDFLSIEERRQVRQAALGIDGNPAYGVEDKDALSVTDASWKFTSLVWTSLDTGLRPVEVGRATVDWVDTSNRVLRIPREESSKNESNWTVSLTDRTATALSRWLEEREQHPRYADTSALWLTRQSNRYGANELRRLMHRLCDRAGIDTTSRQMSWYTIRHSVGTFMTKERDLAATKAQLRHKNAKTTMKYDQVPVTPSGPGRPSCP
jgi:integrase